MKLEKIEKYILEFRRNRRGYPMIKNGQPNRLIYEKSPYLLQHAYNSVDWYPWCDEAFKKAKIENKPIFLSIGYSTCHWCHVMARESFEDQEIANILNEFFIAIKVDREERPDIDHIYMTVCQIITGQGGWPLSIFMTPDKKPFFAGTYFPKDDRWGMRGLASLLKTIHVAWENNSTKLLSSSDKIIEVLNQSVSTEGEDIDDAIMEKVFSVFQSDFDEVYGGFGIAPKFPTPHQLFFLLRYWQQTKEDRALTMVEKTLDGMYCGGIYDHIGYGFCRYSTDQKWLVPHFEKMLYDNALLSIAYLETYQITKKKRYARVAEEIFTYVLRDMTSKEGGFYCAEDADSEGEEGKFYVWTKNEIKKILGVEDGEKLATYFNVTDKGNFEGNNILNLIDSSLAEEEPFFIKECKEKLFSVREKRIHPHKDDKILTSWNGLMIAALAIGARVLKKEQYQIAAERAIKFIEEYLTRVDGRLLARYRDGEADFLAYAEDYSFLIWGLFELYQTTFNQSYLTKAIQLSHDLIKYFWDQEQGGLFVYGKDSEQLITRPKELYDGAIPSGNSVAAFNFLRLAQLVDDHELEEKGNQILKSFGSQINEYPKGYSFALMAQLFSQIPKRTIVIVARDKDIQVKKMMEIIHEQFMPFTLITFYSKDQIELKNVIPNIEDYKMIEEKPTAYICQNYTCYDPITDFNQLKEMLHSPLKIK